MKSLTLVILLILFSSSASAQVLQVVSHYPETAFVVDRLLAFSLNGGEEIEVISVEVEGTGKCTGLPDPFHSDVFHLFCREPGVYDVLIRAQADNFNEILVLNNVSVAVQRAPASEAEQVNREAAE